MSRLVMKSIPRLMLFAFIVCSLPTAALTQEAADGAEADKVSEATSKAWWNQARFIDRLALNADARLQMDAVLSAHLENIDSRGEVMGQLNKALLAGEWDDARAALEAVNKARSEAFGQQTELKIKVLEMLAPNQRQVLASDFPRLISRPWIKPQRDGAKAGNRRNR